MMLQKRSDQIKIPLDISSISGVTSHDCFYDCVKILVVVMLVIILTFVMFSVECPTPFQRKGTRILPNSLDLQSTVEGLIDKLQIHLQSTRCACP